MKTFVKRILWLLPVVLLIYSESHSQENASLSDYFLETMPASLNKTDFANKYELDYDVIKSFFPVRIDLNKLLNENELAIKINNDIIRIKKDKLIKHGLSSYGFFGRSEGKDFNNVVITTRKDNVIGSFFLDSIKYSITTFKDDEYYLMEVVARSAKLDDDYIYEETAEEVINNNVKISDKLSTIVDSENLQDLIAATMAINSVNACNMRILVLYTPAAEAAMSDIQNSIQHAINLSNQYMANSLVSETWELAYSGLTIYYEYPGDGRIIDRNRFRNNGDGYMDEVHNLREKFSADVCVLISKCMESGSCGGIAYAIDAATPANAFCLVHSQYLQIGNDNTVFPHEIGHLLACRHENDVSATPYAYGHGYAIPGTSYTTIMATIPNHIPHWSNPYRVYDSYETGTASWNDCARVLRDEIPEKIHFLQPENNIVITSADITNMSFGDVISEQAATLSGVTIFNGSILKIRSNEVTINNGFTAELGAELEIISESVLDCP